MEGKSRFVGPLEGSRSGVMLRDAYRPFVLRGVDSGSVKNVGVLRLRGGFTVRSRCFAQDDSGLGFFVLG